jgi:hypothetical protein
MPTFQAESLVAAEPRERQQLAVRRANEFLREEPESNFRVGDRSSGSGQRAAEPRLTNPGSPVLRKNQIGFLNCLELGLHDAS